MMNTYLAGNIVFDGDVRVSADSELVAIFEDENEQTVHTEQIEFDPKTLPVFRYTPFEIKIELDESNDFSFRVEVRNGSTQYQSKPRKINCGVEQLDVQMRRAKQRN